MLGPIQFTEYRDMHSFVPIDFDVEEEEERARLSPKTTGVKEEY